MTMQDRIESPPCSLVTSTFDKLGCGVIVLDERQRVVLWNRWVEKYSGIASSAALGIELTCTFPELKDSRLSSAVDSALNKGFPSLLSQSLNKAPFPFYSTPPSTADGAANGQRIQQRIQVLPLDDADRASRCMIEIQDVSLAAYRESVLKEQKNFLNAVLESEPECVVVMTPQGKTIQINRAGLDMLQLVDATELNRASFAGFVLPEHRANFEALFQAALSGEKRIAELQIKGRHGATLWLEMHVAPLRSTQKTVTAVLAVARDTTARREAEATTRALVDANLESALLIDETGIIRTINEIGARRFGRTALELIGKNAYSILPAELVKSRRSQVEKVFRTGEAKHYHDVIFGTHFDINIYPVFDATHRVVAISIYAADVTERMQIMAVDKLFHDIDQRVLQGYRQDALFEFICTEVTRIFGYEFAWIGRKHVGGEISILAWGGAAADYLTLLQKIGIRWDNSPLGQGPAGAAIRSGQTQIFTKNDKRFAPWGVAAERFGLQAKIGIPLILRGEVYGSFTLLSTHDSSFSHPTVVQRLTDIASRICVSIERALDQEQLLLLGTALSSTANGVFITDRSGRIQWLNEAFVAITGASREQSLGVQPRLLQSNPDAVVALRDMQDGHIEVWSGESVERRKDGASYYIRQTITPIRNASGEAMHFVSILEDVTVARVAEASMQRLAHYDYLTGLPNRALFHDRLEQALTQAKRGSDLLALMFLDLDRFKQVNDTYGHDVGDLLLKGVAERLKSCVRESDTVARLAGDEFTLILPSASHPRHVAAVAAKILAAIAATFDFDRVQFQASASIGIALYPNDATNAPALLKCADSAMYLAKSAGRNKFSFCQPQKIAAMSD